MVHGCEQLLIRSVGHIFKCRITIARPVKAKVLIKAFLLNFESPYAFDLINYDFVTTYMASFSDFTSIVTVAVFYSSRLGLFIRNSAYHC